MFAYALGQKQYAEPGDFCNKTLDVSQLVVRIANLVKEDLIALGCADAATWSAAETRTACPGGNLIALRMNPGLDYHFMRLDNSDGQWYHKPDVKAVMRYTGNPLAVNPYWTNEGYIGNTYQAGEMTYCSAIYIIGYNFEHVCEFEYCGGSRHILTCVDCGVTEGAAVACMVKNNVCVACGHDFDGFQIAAMEKNAIIDERQRG